MSSEILPTESRTETVIRWALFVPAALIVSLAAQFLVTLLSRIFFGPRNEASVPQAIFLGGVILLGGALFVSVGAAVAPATQRKTARTLFWVYAALFLLVELFRPPSGYEPLSHPVRLGLGILGAVAGLLLALFQIKGSARRAAAVAAAAEANR